MVALDLHLESAAAQHGQAKLNVEEYAKGSFLSGGNYKEEKVDGPDADDYEKFEKGIMQYGYVFHSTYGYLVCLASSYSIEFP
jgi:RING finger/CHY zinc finger protein 1